MKTEDKLTSCFEVQWGEWTKTMAQTQTMIMTMTISMTEYSPHTSIPSCISLKHAPKKLKTSERASEHRSYFYFTRNV